MREDERLALQFPTSSDCGIRDVGAPDPRKVIKVKSTMPPKVTVDDILEAMCARLGRSYEAHDDAVRDGMASERRLAKNRQQRLRKGNPA